jgi:hypothetical protein
MSGSKINEQILKWIMEYCEEDKVVRDFLIDLIYEEVEHSGQWRWKDTYRKKIKKYSENWSIQNEN